MHFTRHAALAAIMATLILFPVAVQSGIAAQEATPAMTYSCESAAAASPMAGMEGMAMGTPAGEHDMAGERVEFDQLYIDMMLPHHGSIVAMAQAALPRLQDERLREIAQNIIDTQSAEQEELRGYREQFYGSADPAPMDDHTMDMMMTAMPGMGSMDDMMLQMDATAQVAAICAAEDADLGFIDLAIPHHEMAIVASEAALEQSTHSEIRDFAQRVIDAQSAEIEELSAIRAELSGGTPAA
jgi:uncharacterized protein (DUF305 family)